MRRRHIGWIVGAVVVAGALVVGRGLAPAAEPSLADTWKAVVLEPQATVTPFLVRLKESGGKWEGEVVASPLLGAGKVTKVEVGENHSLHLTVEAGGRAFTWHVHPAKDEAKPEKLVGNLTVGAQRQFGLLQRTDAKELPRNEAFAPNPGMATLSAAVQKGNAKDRVAALKEFLDGKPDNVSLAYLGRSQLLKAQAAADAPADELRPTAEALVQTAAEFAPDMKTGAELEAARALVAKAPRLALGYAQGAEKGLGKDASPEQQAGVLKIQAAALRHEGKDGEELKEVTARLDKIEGQLDEAFKKNAIPFKVQPYAGRKDKSDRLVLVELFTGSQCPPCVAADVAFDAALQTYKENEVAFLEYHEHIPGPDPMTNKGTEERMQYYAIRGTPTAYVDGKQTDPLGGPKQTVEQGGQKYGSESSYEKLTGKINDGLGAKPEAKLDLKAERDGDTITIHASAEDVKKDAKDVRLRLALVEEVVRYPGGNGQRLHHHVVRDMPGGVKGTAVENGSAKVETKVDLAKLRQALEEYLADCEKRGRNFSDDSRPLDLKHLKVVAFLQSDDSKEVLQAAQVDVGPGK